MKNQQRALSGLRRLNFRASSTGSPVSNIGAGRADDCGGSGGDGTKHNNLILFGSSPDMIH